MATKSPPRAPLTGRASRCCPRRLNSPSGSGRWESLRKAHRAQQVHTHRAWPAPSLSAAPSDLGKHIVRTVRGVCFGIWIQAPSTTLVQPHRPDSRTRYREAERFPTEPSAGPQQRLTHSPARHVRGAVLHHPL